jgi:hypothetical protein
MLGTIPQDPALVSPPRLLLTQPRASRAILDGAWWPRSWDTPAELSGLVLALSEHYGRIRSVMLNGSAWDRPSPQASSRRSRGSDRLVRQHE